MSRVLIELSRKASTEGCDIFASLLYEVITNTPKKDLKAMSLKDKKILREVIGSNLYLIFDIFSQDVDKCAKCAEVGGEMTEIITILSS